MSFQRHKVSVTSTVHNYSVEVETNYLRWLNMWIEIYLAYSKNKILQLPKSTILLYVGVIHLHFMFSDHIFKF